MGGPLGLVVDDDAQVREVLAEALRRGGMTVLEANSGTEAFSVAQASRLAFVVTDLEMPDGGGVELCRQLRGGGLTAHLPIVVVSGSAVSQGDEAVAAGCNVVLPKPCSPAELVATIRRLIGETSGGPAPLPVSSSSVRSTESGSGP